MTGSTDPGAPSATPSPAATARYPRNRWVRLLRNLLFSAGILVSTFVVITITDSHPDNLGIALGKILFPFGQPGEGIFLALLVLGAAWALYDEFQEVRLKPRVPWPEQVLQYARNQEPRARKDAERAQRRGKPRQEMEALDPLGSALFNLERYDEAMRVEETRLELAETLQDPKAQYSALHRMALIASDKVTWRVRSDSLSGASWWRATSKSAAGSSTPWQSSQALRKTMATCHAPRRSFERTFP